MFQGPRDEIEEFFVDAGFPTERGWNPCDHVSLYREEREAL